MQIIESKSERTNTEWAELVRCGFFDEYTYEARRRYQKSASALSVEKSGWVVEVGCGTGRYHRLLKELGYHNLVSCDLTLAHVARAREINPAGHFVVASGERLPFKDKSFDGLVTNAAIEHFANPMQGIQEFERVTNQMATLVVTSDCYSWRIMQLLGVYRSKMPIDRTMTYSRFRALFARAGLTIRSADAWGITHYLRMIGKVSNRFPVLRERATRDEHWSNRMPRRELSLRLRMLTLDENLFVLDKRDRMPGLSQTPNRGELRLTDVLACVQCRGSLRIEEEAVACLECGAQYKVVNGIPIFP